MTCLAEVHTPVFSISTIFISITDLLLQIREGWNSTSDKVWKKYIFFSHLLILRGPNSENTWFILNWTTCCSESKILLQYPALYNPLRNRSLSPCIQFTIIQTLCPSLISNLVLKKDDNINILSYNASLQILSVFKFLFLFFLYSDKV